MIGVYREFEGSMRLVMHVVRGLKVLVIDRELAVPRKIYLDLIGLGHAKASSGKRGAAAARALIEGLGEKASLSRSAPAATEPNAGH